MSTQDTTAGGNGNYKDTLNLPDTPFPMKANLPEREPQRLAQWEAAHLYEQIIAGRKAVDAPEFVLHDGPPYANGHIHHGHILNKILKDMVVKYRTMAGCRAQYIPGWDCHGLPIELQVERNLGDKAKTLSKEQFREQCREYARSFIDIQRQEFKRLGVFGQWDDPYLTLSKEYEGEIASRLAGFVRRGTVQFGVKPVYWCAACGSALAEAEVEYADHTSPSIYVKFRASDEFKQKAGLPPEAQVSVVIWTTTPWTIPANLAIALNPAFEYVTVRVGGEWLVMAEGLREATLAACGLTGEATAPVNPKAVENTACQHPLFDRGSKMILADYVTLEAGTGCVHTAPGHGPDDFYQGRKYGLDAFCPVDATGRFTAEAGEFAGQPIFKANAAVTRRLAGVGALQNKEGDSVTHSYPHCWRHKTPLFFRAAEQWFVSMDVESRERPSLRKQALAAIDTVKWIPEWGRERIHNMIANRPDWCISRQRLWGVPIPTFQCQGCGTRLIDPDVIDHVAGLFRQHYADVWFAWEAEKLLPPATQCKHCQGSRFTKENNTLDVWFDSGVSFAAGLAAKMHGPVTADLYLEGSDQHRGWFHSSLLCGVGTGHGAPYKAVLTHGFVVDGEGRPYSKSRFQEAKRQGLKIDYTPPDEFIAKFGAEPLRLWVASEDYRYDIRFSSEITTRLGDAYRKIRNTFRFMLGNLSDFTSSDAVKPLELAPLDQWAVAQLMRLRAAVLAAYETYEFHSVFKALLDFCTVTLSNTYLDILKDRLYCSAKTDPGRRGAQTALWWICRDLARLAAPIMVFTADEVWELLPGYEGKSVHFALMPGLTKDGGPITTNADTVAAIDHLLAVRKEVLKALEMARQAKRIGKSEEAAITLDTGADAALLALLDAHTGELNDLFIVSRVRLAPIATGEATHVPEDAALAQLKIRVETATGHKCPRCWRVYETVGSDPRHPELCARCTKAVTGATGGKP